LRALSSNGDGLIGVSGLSLDHNNLKMVKFDLFMAKHLNK